MSRSSHRTLGSSSSGSSHKVGKESGRESNTKCIVTVGILLPLFAAIIGITAWSLTSDSVHNRQQSSSLFQTSRGDYFEERNDDIIFGQKLPIGAAINKDVLGPDIVPDERDPLPIAPGTEESPGGTEAERDPLYVVHYVPQKSHNEEVESTKATSVQTDVLSKILAAGKDNSKAGTPQFVVFAPMASTDGHAEDDFYNEEYIPRKKEKKRRKSSRKDNAEVAAEQHQVQTRVRRPRVKTAPRHYESGEIPHEPEHSHDQWEHHTAPQHPPPQHHAPQHHPHQHHAPQHHYPHHQPCCQHPHATEPPKQVNMNVMPVMNSAPLGILRQLLRPKYDLKKKLFFGIQLENGVGFGGQTEAPTTSAPTYAHQGGHAGYVPGHGGQHGGYVPSHGGQHGGRTYHIG